MDFRVESTLWYDDDLLEKYPGLSKFNYQHGVVRIDSLDQLRDFIKTVGHAVIINTECNVIEIYDGYRE